MDAVTLQAKIYSGYAKAAQRLGVTTQVFRPSEAADPFTHPVATIKASVTTGDSYNAPPKYSQATWQGLFDGSQTQVGDYLVQTHQGVWFIAALPMHLPIVCVACERRITLSRPKQDPAKGAADYEDVCQDAPQILLGIKAAWPVSLLLGGRQQQGATLPSSEQEAGYLILLPGSVPVVIQPGDTLTDDLARRYRVRTAESTKMGWRLQVYEAHV